MPPPDVWFLAVGGPPLLLDLPGGRFCPVFGSADLARQFIGYAGLESVPLLHPLKPSARIWGHWKLYCQRKGCQGLVVIFGIHPWQAQAVASGGEWSDVREPDAVLV